eukprot:4454887-Amphidinium_carterae.1
MVKAVVLYFFSGSSWILHRQCLDPWGCQVKRGNFQNLGKPLQASSPPGRKGRKKSSNSHTSSL